MKCVPKANIVVVILLPLPLAKQTVCVGNCANEHYTNNTTHSRDSSKMVVLGLFLLSLFWSLVHCQHTVPYVSFMGQTLANHSFVNLSHVGNDASGSNSVQCRTDLDTCCRGGQGPHRGDWYFPTGERLPFIGYGAPLVESRQARRVDLHHRSSGPSGIYRCDIETIAVNGNGMRETVYVGLYAQGGMCIEVLKIMLPTLHHHGM